ncbi:NRDE family protein [Actomonas aquatica]|uniref:NRDE family protein n=1 Tax=Actomonas aquatica TaxID=2866162 RepID=A0ABZ1C6D3_9BACT|nr:NRDE family protein [Opitutus sp. WL0086]WRQ87154.1 NRDE family protein [Opitutus sp. WL0086]
MCTLSWRPAEAGYTLWFNRDELHSRAAEEPPREFRTIGGVAWLAPTDPDSGGTWLMVNQQGVTVALLNDYGSTWSEPLDGPRESRGRLAPLAAAAGTATDAIGLALRAGGLDRTPPFNLVAIDGDGGAAHLHWNGAEIRLREGDDVAAPLTSSSYASERVVAARQRAYPRNADAAALAAYHHSHDTERGAESVNMSRADAATRSITQVRVGPEWVVLDYEPQNWPGAPRVAGGPRQWRLPRQDVFSSINAE